MKNFSIILIIVLLSVLKCNAQDRQQKIDSIYRVRSYVVRELLSFGFEVEVSNKRLTILSTDKGPGDYFYQVAVTTKKRELDLRGYVFLHSHIRKAWTEKPFYGKEKIHKLMYSGVQRSKGIIMPEIYLWSWERVLLEEE